MIPTDPSAYELRRWHELETYWERAARPATGLPPRVRTAVNAAGAKTKQAMAQAANAVSTVTPRSVKDLGTKTVDASLVLVANAATHLLELTTDWVAELTNPEPVTRHDQKEAAAPLPGRKTRVHPAAGRRLPVHRRLSRSPFHPLHSPNSPASEACVPASDCHD